jgi:subtilisin family serine protease
MKALIFTACTAAVVFAGTARIAAPSPSTGHTIRVAVLDSGVDSKEPELTGKIVATHDFVRSADTGWHGTAVADVIATSICSRCTIVSAKVLGAKDTGNDDEIARGLLWAVDSGARVINLSMTGPGESPTLRDAIRTATGRGVVVVAAAGNAGASTKTFPAADPNVIGVAASNAAGGLFRWSNRGAWVAIAAPGQTPTFRGTSAAAPAVAAVAAACLAAAPQISPQTVRRILVHTAKPIAGMPFGRLDVSRAVRACTSA